MARKKVADISSDRFHPEPDDLVHYRSGILSRFGQDKGSVRRPIVNDIADVEGRAVIVNRLADNLDRLKSSGDLTTPMYNAAREFKDFWAITRIDSVKTSNLSDSGTGSMSMIDVIERTRFASQMIRNVQKLLGGEQSDGYKIVVGYVIYDRSLRSLAGAGGKRSMSTKAKLIKALEEMGKDYDRRTKGRAKRKITKA